MLNSSQTDRLAVPVEHTQINGDRTITRTAAIAFAAMSAAAAHQSAYAILGHSYPPPPPVYCMADLCLGGTLHPLLNLELRASGLGGFTMTKLRDLVDAPVSCKSIDLSLGSAYFFKNGVKTEVGSSSIPTRASDSPRNAYRISNIRQFHVGNYDISHAMEAITEAKRRWPSLGEVIRHENQLYANSETDGVQVRVIVGPFTRIDAEGLTGKSGMRLSMHWSFAGRSSEAAQGAYDAQPECASLRPVTPRF
jgi:hypothetical protein